LAIKFVSEAMTTTGPFAAARPAPITQPNAASAVFESRSLEQANVQEVPEVRQYDRVQPAGQPAELASIYVQLAADDASFATGNVYGSGGGQGQP
jgi:hypothetical protein